MFALSLTEKNSLQQSEEFFCLEDWFHESSERNHWVLNCDSSILDWDS